MKLEASATRLWKRLPREQRLDAARAFWEGPPAEAAAGALSAIVKARRLRPQVARSLPLEQRAQALAGALEPGESVAAALLVALHLSSRRPMLGAFLDALGLPHEDGILKQEAEAAAPPSQAALAAAAAKLAEAYPSTEIATYFNTLWLQDPERWDGLARLELETAPAQPSDPGGSPPSSRGGKSSQ